MSITYVTPTSRSDLDIVCGRTSVGNIKADVGDIFGFVEIGANNGLRTDTWYVCISVTTTEMTLRQLNNYAGDTQYDYRTNGRNQVTTTGTQTYYVCTRIRQLPSPSGNRACQHGRLWADGAEQDHGHRLHGQHDHVDRELQYHEDQLPHRVLRQGLQRLRRSPAAIGR